MTKVGSIANEYDSVLVWSSSSGYFSSYYVTTHWHCICCYVLLWKTRNKRRKRKICPKRKKIKIYATMKVGFPSTLVKLKSVGAKYCKNSYSLHMCDVTFWFSKKSSLFPSKNQAKIHYYSSKFWKKCHVTHWLTPSLPLVSFGDTGVCV